MNYITAYTYSTLPNTAPVLDHRVMLTIALRTIGATGTSAVARQQRPVRVAVRLARWPAGTDRRDQARDNAMPNPLDISAYRRLLAVVAARGRPARRHAGPGAARHRAGQRRSDHGFRHRTAQQADPAHGDTRRRSRQEVIEELIEEKLKLQLLKRFTIEGMDNEVDSAYANMARRARMTAQGLTDTLEKSGIKPGTLKSRIKAEHHLEPDHPRPLPEQLPVHRKGHRWRSWSQAIRKRPSVGYDYTLRPILFVVPRGSPDGLRDTRRKEAEALRARFMNCDEGVRLARGLRDVAVRGSTVKSSADLAPGAARHSRQDGNRQADPARSDRAGHRGLRGVPPGEVQRREHAGQAQGPRRAGERAVRGQGPRPT